MSRHLYLLLAGHSGIVRWNGQEHYLTAGKRSPEVGPGVGIYEGEFNRLVCQNIQNLTSVDTCFLNPGVENMSQANRVKLVNSIDYLTGRKCILLVVHANADGHGKWTNANGFATFHARQSSVRSRQLASIIDDQFSGAWQKSRGIIQRNFDVLRKTTSPAVLFECAFMTNRKEAAFMANNGPYYYGLHLANALKTFEDSQP